MTAVRATAAAATTAMRCARRSATAARPSSCAPSAATSSSPSGRVHGRLGDNGINTEQLRNGDETVRILLRLVLSYSVAPGLNRCLRLLVVSPAASPAVEPWHLACSTSVYLTPRF